MLLALRKYAEDRARRRSISAAQRIVLGAGPTDYPGWVATDRGVLDIAERENHRAFFKPFEVAENLVARRGSVRGRDEARLLSRADEEREKGAMPRKGPHMAFAEDVQKVRLFWRGGIQGVLMSARRPEGT